MISVISIVIFIIIIHIFMKGFITYFKLKTVNACDKIYKETPHLLLTERKSSYNHLQKLDEPFQIIHYQMENDLQYIKENIPEGLQYDDSYELYKDGKPHLYCLFPYQVRHFTRKNILVINGYVKQFKYLCIFARIITNNKNDLKQIVSAYVVNDELRLKNIFHEEIFEDFYEDTITYSSFIYKNGRIYAKKENVYEPYVYLTAFHLIQLSKLCTVHYLENQEHTSLFKVQLLTDKLEAKRIIHRLRWININNKLLVKLRKDKRNEEKEIS